MNIIDVVLNWITTHTTIEIKSFLGVLSGGLLQYSFSKNKGYRVLLIITLSSIFMSLFILDPILTTSGVSESSPIRVVAFSCSALISVELINIIIRVLPKAATARLGEILGIKENERET